MFWNELGAYSAPDTAAARIQKRESGQCLASRASIETSRVKGWGLSAEECQAQPQGGPQSSGPRTAVTYYAGGQLRPNDGAHPPPKAVGWSDLSGISVADGM